MDTNTAEMIIISFKGGDILIFKQVADRLNIPNGYEVKNEVEYWKILAENLSVGLLICTAHLHPSN